MRHPDSGFLAGLDEEQRVRYAEWWASYLRLKRMIGLAAAANILCWLLLWNQGWGYSAAKVLAPITLIAFFAVSFWFTSLECPRCGESFRGWMRNEDAYFPDECQNCGLRGTQLEAIPRHSKAGT